MKFVIRDGFVVKIVKSVDQGEGQPPVLQENTYFQRQTVDLEPQDARDHAHKLEPAKDSKGRPDADSAAFLDALVVQSPTPPSNADIDRLVAVKVAEALAAVLGPAAAAAMASQVPAPGTGSPAA